MHPVSSAEVTVQVLKLHPAAQLPDYSFTGPFGDLAADLHAVEEVTLSAAAPTAVRTGLALGLPAGFGALVESRSGLALKGIAVLGGVIDPGYRGELKVILAFTGQAEHARIKAGDRIAQLRLVRRLEGEFRWVESLEETGRGAAGFGSTGAGPRGPGRA